MENNQNNMPLGSSPQPVPDYGFIVQNSPKKTIFKLNSGSLKFKLVVVTVGFLALLLIFIIIKGLLSTSPFNKNDFLTVLQDQNNILNIFTQDVNSSQIQSAISTNNSNFVSEATLVLGTDQSNILSYLKNNGIVFNTTQLNLGINQSYATELNNSIGSNNLNPTFNQIISSLLTSYKSDLSTCYSAEKGPIGKQILIQDYKDANLLLKMLNSPKS